MDATGSAVPGAGGARHGVAARQVLTLFGDYWWGIGAPVPAGAMVAALGDLGVKEAAARATLSRLVRTGLLRAERTGRRTAHALTDRATEIVREEADWLESFGVDEPEWDGQWSVLAFSIPEARRTLRHHARVRLKWLGFAPLYDGVWISPLTAAEEALAQLRALGVGDLTAMRATLHTSPDGPQRAWDLDAVAQHYARFAADVRASAPIDDPAGALRERSQLMLAWQGVRGVDAGLPARLLPAPWPRVTARRLFAERFDRLGPLAEQRIREHVATIDAALAERVTARRLAR